MLRKAVEDIIVIFNHIVEDYPNAPIKILGLQLNESGNQEMENLEKSVEKFEENLLIITQSLKTDIERMDNQLNNYSQKTEQMCKTLKEASETDRLKYQIDQK